MRAPILAPSRCLRGLLLLPIAAILLLLGSSCYSLHNENSWIRIQNMGSTNATVEIKYVSESGQTVAVQTCPTWGVCPYIAPGAGWTFAASQNPALPSGFLGSAIITSDQPIAVILAKDADGGGGYYETAGDTVSLNAGSDKLYLPLIMNRDGPAQNWDSRFAVENMGSTTACATLVYTANANDAEVHREPDAGATPQPNCPKGGIPIAPGGTLFRSVPIMGVGPYFTGSVRVDLAQNGQGTPPSQQYVVATTDIFSSTSRHFSGYSGLTSADMGTSLVLPLIERTASGEWNTDFEIMNSNPSKPANVTIRFDGWDGNNQFVSKTTTFTVRSSRQCYQDSDTANCLAPGDTLPQNFHDGTAWVSSDQPVGVIVSRGSNRSDTYVNYRGLRIDAAGQRVYLPLVNKNSPTGSSRTGWNSWVRVMVTDGGAANLRIRYIDPSLPGGEVSYNTSMYRTATFITLWEQGLPNGFSGSMIIESDRPIVALGNVTTGPFGGDPDFMYEGVVAH
jgi:hypothetical protein